MEENINISIIVPALNEEKNIASAVRNISTALSGRNDYEILIFNDGSTDQTGEIADALASSSSRIRVIHHALPQNLGGCFREGVAMARGEYAVMLPGDDETDSRTIKNLFKALGSAEIVTTYTVNKKIRSWSRRFISAIYTNFLNFLFGLNLRYFNGPSLIKTDLLKKAPIASNFAYMSAILVRLIKAGYHYKEIEMIIKPPQRQSRALKLKNVYYVLLTILDLFTDIYLRHKIL
ncbi:MAG: glycosyltransferase family 2 protein [Patescibacteria group bacterium]